MTSDLIRFDLLKLTEDAAHGDANGAKPGAYNIHPKALKKMHELRLRQPLPTSMAGELTQLPNLTSLYLEAGIESPQGLAKIAAAAPNLTVLHMAVWPDEDLRGFAAFAALTSLDLEFIAKPTRSSALLRLPDMPSLTSLGLSLPKLHHEIDVSHCPALKTLELETTQTVGTSQLLLPRSVDRLNFHCREDFVPSQMRKEPPAILVLATDKAPALQVVATEGPLRAEAAGFPEMTELQVSNGFLDYSVIPLLAPNMAQLRLTLRGSALSPSVGVLPAPAHLHLAVDPEVSESSLAAVPKVFPQLTALTVSGIKNPEVITKALKGLSKLRHFHVAQCDQLPPGAVETLAAAFKNGEFSASCSGGPFIEREYRQGQWTETSTR